MNKLRFHNFLLRKIVNSAHVNMPFYSRAEEHLDQFKGQQTFLTKWSRLFQVGLLVFMRADKLIAVEKKLQCT